ncbi:MAG TPA: hypothetical protein VJ910_14190 [Desulfuromonadales bacterium]|nr:hypothetical protein [Desulfuromonadales bacterium]
MSIYRVEKTEQNVVLFQADGSVMKGVVFLSASAYNHLGQQTLLDLIHEKDTFFPFRSDSGEFLVANKNTVTHIRYKPGTKNPHYSPLGEPEPVSITFVGGEQLHGVIIIDLPEGRKRLLDFINAAAGFFEVQGDDCRYLVNTTQIRDVCPS